MDGMQDSDLGGIRDEDLDEQSDSSPGWFGAGIEVTEDGSSDEEGCGEEHEQDTALPSGEKRVASKLLPIWNKNSAEVEKSHPVIRNPVSGNNGNNVRPNCTICGITFASSLAAEKHFQRVHVQKVVEASGPVSRLKSVTATTQESEKRIQQLMKDRFKDLDSDDEYEEKNPLWWQLEKNPCLIANPEVYERAEKEGEIAQKLAEKIDFRNKDMRTALKVPAVSVKQTSNKPFLSISRNRDPKSAESFIHNSAGTGNISAPEVSISVVKPSKTVAKSSKDGEDKLSLEEILNLDPTNVECGSTNTIPPRRREIHCGVEGKDGGMRKVRIVKLSSEAAMKAKLGGGKVISLQRPIVTAQKNDETPSEEDRKRKTESTTETTTKEEPAKARRLARTVADNKKLNQSSRNAESAAESNASSSPKPEDKSPNRPRRDGRTRRSAAPTDFSGVYKLDQMVSDIMPGQDQEDEDGTKKTTEEGPNTKKTPKRLKATKGSEAAEKLGEFLRHNAELGRLKAVEEGIMTTERYVCILCGVSLLRKSDIEKHVAILHYQFRCLGVPSHRIGLKRDLREEESALFKKNSLAVKMAHIQSERLSGGEKSQKERYLAQFLNKWKPDEPQAESEFPEQSDLAQQSAESAQSDDSVTVPAFAAEIALGEDGTMEKKVNLDPSGRPGRKPGPLSYMRGVTVSKEPSYKSYSPRPNISLRGISAAPQTMKPAEVRPNLNLHRAFFSRGMPLPKHCRKIRLEIDINDGEKRSMYQYQCDLCMGTFSDRPNIINHLQSVHEVGFFPCKLCKTILPTTTELELHNKTKHEI